MAAHQLRLEDGPGAPAAGACRLEVMATTEVRTGAAGVGWRITGALGAFPPCARSRLRVGSRIAAELVAVDGGLREAARRGATDVRIRTDDPALPGIVEGVGPKRFRRALRAAGRLAATRRRFRSVEFEVGSAHDPELAHAVGEALDEGLHRVAEREEHRAHAIEQIRERARDVRLERRDSRWIANDRYAVSLDPFDCECPAWRRRWARVPLAGRRAERLPCKHLVALAARSGLVVPVDLAELARSAPR